MKHDDIKKIARRLNISEKQIQKVYNLFGDGATIPFIARYRKEMTGSLDEVQLQQIRDEITRLETFNKRLDTIIDSLNTQNKFTPELQRAILACDSLTQLEDLYLPYRPRRRTRAEAAREKGLEPLAQQIYNQADGFIDLKRFINRAKELNHTEDILSGAKDIIAEWISEDTNVRQNLREQFSRFSQVTSKVVKKKKDEAFKFSDYFDWSESASRIPSHRLLAILRGQHEGFLTVHALPDKDKAISHIKRLVIKSRNYAASIVSDAIADSYSRLLQPSLESELLKAMKEKADEDAITVFSSNLNELLLAPPLGEKPVIAIDPGFRTGCKSVLLDRYGNLQKNATIFPFDSPEKAENLIKEWGKKAGAIAIGNGTAGRETETFIKALQLEIPTIMVDESGASIYSASEIAREEFPNLDLTVRGAISIGRRLQDPLAELVKLDPKSIGVGQYQHDVDQNQLRSGLNDVVIHCVNAVGVELNTASARLLSHISGLGPQLAKNIVTWREKNGAFASRAQLKKVPRLGPKAFEQAAGFLRIANATNPLDRTAVHPESYPIVKQMSQHTHCKIEQLIAESQLHNKLNLSDYITDKVGLPTLKDIINELEKPGRDPRASFSFFSFADEVHSVDDLQRGMKLPGLVTNVTNFGAFVDIGVHQDGLVHISEMADRYISDPSEIVKVRQQVEVTVLEIDLKRKRIALSMKQ